MVDGRRAALWTYGGSFPGKLIRVREGETVRLRFTNRLPEVTNLHFHGLHVPPTGRADNSWLHVPPGETFAYEFEVPRGSAGTYWYHPHAHGTLARQLWAGLVRPAGGRRSAGADAGAGSAPTSASSCSGISPWTSRAGPRRIGSWTGTRASRAISSSPTARSSRFCLPGQARCACA